uniref:Uncharacterized protein n=1 Tax=Panagrolaimus sp. ES5 TaxID=591445 RepID=A0AC34G5U8_9BILA
EIFPKDGSFDLDSLCMFAQFNLEFCFFKALVASENLKNLEICGTVICSNSSEAVPFEDILQLTPKLERLDVFKISSSCKKGP